MLFRSVGP